MKAIYKTLIVLAATLAVAPTLSAQSVNPEKYQLNNGIGYNKYLVSNQPNSDGEYTLRLETFATGDVQTTATPTDFVILMDCSGSMLSNYKLAGQSYEPYYSLEEIETPGSPNYGLLKMDTGRNHVTRHSYKYVGRYGYVHPENTTWASGFGINHPLVENYQIVADADPDYARWIRYEDSAKPSNNGYYVICRGIRHKDGQAYRNLLIILKDGSARYLKGTEIQTEINMDDPVTEEQEDETHTNVVHYEGPAYRPKQRWEVLIEATESFITAVVNQNNDASLWAPGVTKNQISLVEFSAGYPEKDNPTLDEYDNSDDVSSTTPENTTLTKTKVLMGFQEAKEELISKPSFFLTHDLYWESTCIDLGVHLSKMLFEDLQTRPGMAPLKSDGSVNRNKVLIVFTDGMISKKGNGTDSETEETYEDRFARIHPLLEDACVLKETGPGKLNTKIYTVDMAYMELAKILLQHLSSDYPEGRATIDHGPIDGTSYSGEQVTVDQYYKNASNAQLTEVFENIASETIGKYVGSKLVAVDKMSESFILPDNLTGKVKFYTAQCIGSKTIDGSEYLAFAREIAAPNRGSLAKLWVSYLDSGGNTQWANQGSSGTGELADIDNEITYSVSSDKKTITIKGFSYGDLWCGLDPLNENTRHPVASNDPNVGNQKDGYRGFKLIVEFPIKLVDGAIGGKHIPTNDDSVSGVYNTNSSEAPVGLPIINYPLPEIEIPITLIIQKTGLKVGESASFTVQRKKQTGSSDYVDYTTFILTGDAANTPEVKLLNLDPDYYYRVKETNWSWSYTSDAMTTFPSTEDPNLANPIVINNTPKDTNVKHAEAKATNVMSTSAIWNSTSVETGGQGMKGQYYEGEDIKTNDD